MKPKQRARAEALIAACLEAWATVISHRGQAEPVITFALDSSTGQVVYFLDDPSQQTPYTAAEMREKRAGWLARGHAPTVTELLALPDGEAVAALRRLRSGKPAIDPDAAYVMPRLGERTR